MAPARTGKERRSKIVVTRTAQANKGICSNSIPKTRKFPSVLIKLIAPKIDDTPAR